MYRPPHFTEENRDRILSFMQRYPLMTLMAAHEGLVQATLVPVLIEERGGQLFLRGHLMRKTEHHIAVETAGEVLGLFTGPQCYVSSGWYSQRGIGATWNYLSAQVRGSIRLLDSAETLLVLTALTHRFEDGQAHPELVENMSDDYLGSHLKAIAGFEICVNDLKATFKLSQNRDDESFRTIVRELQKTEDPQAHEIARLMREDRPQLNFE